MRVKEERTMKERSAETFSLPTYRKVLREPPVQNIGHTPFGAKYLILKDTKHCYSRESPGTTFRKNDRRSLRKHDHFVYTTCDMVLIKREGTTTSVAG